ncbi:MAG: tRNA uridine(34) 5-carboxymethylaminomethyl modification radical SAM/GNAT enzyme Elp3 [Candidatus Kerfeldbacteria bacterium]|nr:tRNA uridine(34) 5-carboxymethylaminomethyl modification radical SAM/GNAT enzyme Elp3 [Candidatus Kerfeldbacteria bacterium]
MSSPEAIHQIIYRAIERGVTTDPELKKIKAAVAKEFDIEMLPNSDILTEYRRLIDAGTLEKNEALWSLFSKRKIRNLSGVAVITVLTKPYFCPGRCVYCPTEARMPKSYLANEPGAARALRNNFDPYRQVSTRLESLRANGHVTDKCELIVLGGTWTAYDKTYQTWFLKRCFDAFNEQRCRTFEEAKQRNETASHRVIGLTLETRPDHVTYAEARRMRRLGCTRVQLGVQSTDEAVLRLTKRDQTNEQVIRATRLLKEAGFKISHHYMQDLPGSTFESDVKTIEDAFYTPDFQPDHIKIYPTAVIKTAVLYRWWKEGKYTPYTPEELLRLLVEIKKRVPEWVRIERLVRDIPSESIHAGNTITNLRQVMQQQGVECRCIRCREPQNAVVAWDDVEIVRRDYEASGGREIFLSCESPDKKTLYAFTRLRLQQLPKHWIPELQDAAIIREIHTYGKLAPIDSGGGAVQHIGFGRRLMAEAEMLARDAGYKKIAVIAGIGVREYFRTKLGYTLEGEYMVKTL